MNNDFERWSFHKQYIDRLRNETLFQERDIFWCSFGKNIGFEQDGKGEDFRRPVLVIKKFNRHVFWGLPLTTKMKLENKYYAPVILPDNLARSAILSQLRLFDAKRLVQKKIGVLSKDQFREIKKALARILGFTARDCSQDEAKAIT